MDILRGVGMRSIDKDESALLLSEKASLVHRNSLPEIKFTKSLAKAIEPHEEEGEEEEEKPAVEVVQSVDAKNQTDEKDVDEEYAGQCAIAGRLEIRVIPKGIANTLKSKYSLFKKFLGYITVLGT